jgi:hypothetical protein
MHIINAAYIPACLFQFLQSPFSAGNCKDIVLPVLCENLNGFKSDSTACACYNDIHGAIFAIKNKFSNLQGQPGLSYIYYDMDLFDKFALNFKV